MRHIKNAAEGYLTGLPDAWIDITESVRLSLVELAEDYSPGRLVNPGHEIFDNAVNAALFDPGLVRSVASANNGKDIRKLLRHALIDAIQESSEEIGAGGEVFYKEQNSLGVSAVALWRPAPKRDPDEPAPWIPMEDFNSALEEGLDNRFGPAADRRDSTGKNRSIVTQLEVVDVAMYTVLKQHPELARNLPWRTFERLIADILEEFQFEVELTQGTKDGGIDVIAIKKDTHFGVHRYLLQAKRWANKVGVEPVQQLLFLQSHHHATKSCLVTTSTFTSGAWQLAEQYKWQLELRDFDGLTKWIEMAHASKLRNSTPQRIE
ncbi:MAG TPA: restriction endonuclease [Longimicrobium sp.]